MTMKRNKWSRWRPFPDPRIGGYLSAPFGPGVYELRNRNTSERILFGQGGNTAFRMSSLLPKPHGMGERSNKHKRKYVWDHLHHIEYRSKACADTNEARDEERDLKKRYAYLFPT